LDRIASLLFFYLLLYNSASLVRRANRKLLSRVSRVDFVVREEKNLVYLYFILILQQRRYRLFFPYCVKEKDKNLKNLFADNSSQQNVRNPIKQPLYKTYIRVVV
jgi:hypothetical protein